MLFNFLALKRGFIICLKVFILCMRVNFELQMNEEKLSSNFLLFEIVFDWSKQN